MHPTLFVVAGFSVATYGLFVALGFLAGIAYLGAKRPMTGLGEEDFNRLLTGVFISGLLGAKALFLALYWDTFAGGLWEMATGFRYGFVFFGGFLGAAAWGWWFCRRHGVSLLKAADPFAPALALGHGIGRLGCFAAGCCYGRPTDLPWGAAFTSPEAMVPFRWLGVPLHPAQLYEAAANFAIAGFLHFALVPGVASGKIRTGTVFLSYLALYSAARFVVEAFRGDDRGFYALGLSVSQWIAAAVLAVTAALWAKGREARHAR